MTIETRNNGIADITVITADEGKDIYCNYLETNYGKEVWLGFVYYDKDNNELEVPYMLKVEDFTEIDEEVIAEPELQ